MILSPSRGQNLINPSPLRGFSHLPGYIQTRTATPENRSRCLNFYNCNPYQSYSNPYLRALSEHALCHHRAGNLHEAGYVGTPHVVDKIRTFLLTVFHTLLVDVLHDTFELLVNLLGAP